MAFSESTTNFGLPQWQPNDKPTYLVDQNTAYRVIDTQMQANKVASESAESSASTALTTAQNAVAASNANAQNIVNLTNTVSAQKLEMFKVHGIIETNPNPKFSYRYLTYDGILYQSANEKHGAINLTQTLGMTTPAGANDEDVAFEINLGNNWTITSDVASSYLLNIRGTKNGVDYISPFFQYLIRQFTITNGILRFRGVGFQSPATLDANITIQQGFWLTF